MGSKIRQQFTNARYHIFSRGIEHRNIFLDEQDFTKFLKIFENISTKRNFCVFSYCLMNNHFHFFIETPEANIADVMRDTQSKYVKYFNEKYDRKGHLFESRYADRIVGDPIYLLTLIKYIHLNPVKANLVNKPEDWAWSSYKFYINKSNISFLKKDVILNKFDDLQSFISFHEEDQEILYDRFFSKLLFK